MAKRPKTRLTRRVAKHFTLPSLAKQAFSQECDINTIMRKFEKTGMVDHLNKHQGNYGDFITAHDYHTSLNLLLAADDAFSTVPAKIRAQFGNDPAKFLEFVQNPDNQEEMIALGLASRRPQDLPPVAPDTTPASPLPAGATTPPATPGEGNPSPT